MSAPLYSTTQTDDLPRAAGSSPVVRIWVLVSAGRLHDEPRLLAPGDAVTIGRSPDGDAVLSLPDDRKLSRCHARIEFHPQRGMQLLDLGSKNGLCLNGRALGTASTPLSDGDVLRMGGSLLLVRQEHVLMSALRDDCRALQSLLRGRSAAVIQLRSALARVARHDGTVLLLGATGTGKELAARAVHQLSGRPGPFVAVNCTTLSASLAESQLFGHNKGAFTGASESHSGFFREAHGGTLFLDEIGDLPKELQPKLLRTLQEKSVRPVGAAADMRVDTRVVAATNVELPEATASGQFRSDLLERLAVLPIALPPLVQRREDILPLFAHFLSGLSGIAANDVNQPHIPIDLAQRLLFHDWPRNVRELRNVCERLHAFCDQPLDLQSIPDDLLFPLRASERQPELPATRLPPLQAMTRDEVVRLLEEYHWNITRAANAIGVDRLRLHRLTKQHQIERPLRPIT